ncbi:hypothetical protein LIA77_09491 [Sarocladium implicatum]|nr:hypothetical protein LIA77_09491 [Sarocladium implicatum]
MSASGCSSKDNPSIDVQGNRRPSPRDVYQLAASLCEESDDELVKRMIWSAAEVYETNHKSMTPIQGTQYHNAMVKLYYTQASYQFSNSPLGKLSLESNHTDFGAVVVACFQFDPEAVMSTARTNKWDQLHATPEWLPQQVEGAAEYVAMLAAGRKRHRASSSSLPEGSSRTLRRRAAKGKRRKTESPTPSQDSFVDTEDESGAIHDKLDAISTRLYELRADQANAKLDHLCDTHASALQHHTDLISNASTTFHDAVQEMRNANAVKALTEAHEVHTSECKAAMSKLAKQVQEVGTNITKIMEFLEIPNNNNTERPRRAVKQEEETTERSVGNELNEHNPRRLTRCSKEIIEVLSDIEGDITIVDPAHVLVQEQTRPSRPSKRGRFIRPINFGDRQH